MLEDRAALAQMFLDHARERPGDELSEAALGVVERAVGRLKKAAGGGTVQPRLLPTLDGVTDACVGVVERVEVRAGRDPAACVTAERVWQRETVESLL